VKTRFHSLLRLYSFLFPFLIDVDGLHTLDFSPLKVRNPACIGQSGDLVQQPISCAIRHNHPPVSGSETNLNASTSIV
jgi:hypothetical protein